MSMGGGCQTFLSPNTQTERESSKNKILELNNPLFSKFYPIHICEFGPQKTMPFHHRKAVLRFVKIIDHKI